MGIETNPALAPGKGFPDFAHRFGTGKADIAQHPVVQFRKMPAGTTLLPPKLETGGKPSPHSCKTTRQGTTGNVGAKGSLGHDTESSGMNSMPGG